MSSFTYLGIDNGVSGSIGIITSENEVFYYKTPIKKCLNYTKAKKWINRIDYPALKEVLSKYSDTDIFVFIERPMINPTRFAASVSAIRAFEASIILLEELSIGYEVIDSKKWQKELLPSGLVGIELKTASLQVVTKLFPRIELKGFKDGDGLLIAEYCRRMKRS